MVPLLVLILFCMIIYAMTHPSKSIQTQLHIRGRDSVLAAATTYTTASTPENIIADPGLIGPEFDIHMQLDASQWKALLFWPCMFRDHCLFIYFGLVPTSDMKMDLLSDRTELIPLDLQLPPEITNQLTTSALAVNGLREQALRLAQAWKDYQDVLLSGNYITCLEQLVPLWNATYHLKHHVRDGLERGLWLGYFSLSLSLGTLQELYYLRARLEHTLSPQQEIAMFMDDAALHMGIAAHYLDDGVWSKEQRKLVVQLLSTAEVGYTVRDQAIIAEEADNIRHIEDAMRFLNTAIESHQWRDLHKPATVGHPLTIKHVLKEAGYEMERLAELGHEIHPGYHNQIQTLIKGI